MLSTSPGHISASAAEAFPACRSRFSSDRNSYGSVVAIAFTRGRRSHTSVSQSGGGGNARPRWSRVDSAFSYTPIQVASLTPVLEAVEKEAVIKPDLRDGVLCHAWDDRQGVTKELHDLLEAAGVKVWFSEKDSGLRVPMMRAIDKGLVASKIGLVLVTSAFLFRLSKEGVANRALSDLL